MKFRPRNYRENLTNLMETSYRLNLMIKDGSFYDLSFLDRYREIRKVKGLYNKLRGPVSEKGLEQAVSFATVVMLAAGARCGNSSGGGFAKVTIDLGLNKRIAAVESISRALAPENVTEIQVNVTGPGMETITQTVTPPESGIITLEVPAGDTRLFEVRAETITDDFYTGTAQENLTAGESVIVPITMELRDETAPDAVKGLVAIPFAGEVILKWAEPSNIDFTKAVITFTPVEESITQPIEVQKGTTQKDITGLLSGTPYTFTIKFEDDMGNQTEGVSVTSTPLNATIFVDRGTNLLGFTSLGSDYIMDPVFVDIDGDGDLEVVLNVLYNSNNPYTYFFDKGDGTFVSSPALPYGLYNSRAFKSFVDIDGDGDLDVFATGTHSNGYTINNAIYGYQNEGTRTTPYFYGATFSFPDPFPFQYGYVLPNFAKPHLSFVDIDADGDQDLFVGGMYPYSPNLQFLRNEGTAESPNFTSPENNPFEIDLSYIPSASSLLPAFVDIDGDGDFDLFLEVGVGSNSYGLLFENTGTASEPSFASYSFASYNGISNISGKYSFPAYTDIDGDGDMDLFIGDQYGNIHYFENVSIPATVTNLTVTRGTGSATLNWAEPINYNSEVDPHFVRSFITFTPPAAGVTQPIEVPAGATMPITINGLDDAAAYTFMVRCVDDIGNISKGATASLLFVNPVANPFGLTQSGSNSDMDPVFVNLDGDSELELLVNKYSPDGMQYFDFNAATKVFESASVPYGLYNTNVFKSFVDIDGDGDLDVFASGPHADGYSINNMIFGYTNTPYNGIPYFGTASMAMPTTIPFKYGVVLPNSQYPILSFVDIDADGDQDLFVGGPDVTPINLQFFRNDGSYSTPGFINPVNNPFGINLTSVAYNFCLTPAFADIDGDGDFDLLLGTGLISGGYQYGDILLFKNIGTPQLPKFAPPVVNPLGIQRIYGNHIYPAVADVDGDGDLDLFVGDQYGNIQYFPNQSTPDITPPANVTDLSPNQSNQSVDLMWIDPSDGDFSKVSITFTPEEGGVTQPIEVGRGAGSVTINGLTNDIEYTFTVRSVDYVGNQSSGVSVSATPFFNP